MAEREVTFFRVECPWCDKPFTLRAEKRNVDPVEEEIVLKCPYCQQDVTVTVPRNIASPETIFRAVKGIKK